MTELLLGATGDYNQQVGMTLAEIAYAEPRYLQQQLAYPKYASGGQWKLRWVGTSPGNQMYVAELGRGAQWAVAIRGSASDPFTEAFWIDWFQQDLQLGTVPPPFDAGPGARISQGSLDGFDDLIAMRDSSGQTLMDFLRANVSLAPQSIVVLGHSLGGCLASVVAPYIYETLCKPANKSPDCILAMSFAAPTAGNEQYAGFLQGLFGGFPYRYVNDLDLAPNCWTLQGLDWIMQSYDPAPKIPDFFYGLVDLVWWALYAGGQNYQQPGPANTVHGRLEQEFWWVVEAGQQHAGETYLDLYGAPRVIFPYPPSAATTGILPRHEGPAAVP